MTNISGSGFLRNCFWVKHFQVFNHVSGRLYVKHRLEILQNGKCSTRRFMQHNTCRKKGGWEPLADGLIRDAFYCSQASNLSSLGILFWGEIDLIYSNSRYIRISKTFEVYKSLIYCDSQIRKTTTFAEIIYGLCTVWK